MKKPILLAILLLSAASAAAAYRIEHLEPSSWWVGMQEPMVQLLVHGERIAELEPAVNYPGVSIRGVERTGNPSYLFVNLAIDATTQPGQFLIDFRRNGKIAVTHTYALRARENGSAERRGFGPSDVIYLVTPDRFANGDPGNDTVAGMKEGVNRKKTGGRHGGDP